MVNKRLINTGVEAAPAVFDPLQNFETVTYTGNGGTQKITGYIRKGAAFNGSSSYVGMAENSWNSFTSYTLSAWIYDTGTATGGRTIASNYGYTSASNVEKGWLVMRVGTKLRISNSTIGLASTYLSTNDIPFNQWTHIVVTNTQSEIKIYFNGSLDSTHSTIGFLNDASWPMRPAIGVYRYETTEVRNGYFSGKIDQVRIFDKAISSSEVTTLYGETYASSTKSTTDIFGDGSGVALYELDEDANSSNFGQSAVFNGSSSKITTSISVNTANSITYSFWIKPNTENSYITFAAAGTTNTNTLLFQKRGDTNAARLVWFNGSTIPLDLNDTTPMEVGVWTHYAFTLNGSTANLYKNGINTVSNVSYSSTYIFPNFTLGQRPYTPSEFFNGSLDQVRIYDTALSSGDVTNLYNESNVPTSGLVAHYKLDGNATDETGSYDGTETSITYSAGVYGGTPTNVNFLGMAFQPDLVWIKNRDTTEHNILIDVIRQNDTGKFLSSNLTNASFNTTQPTFDSNGFTLDGVYNGYLNNTNNDYVAWCWKAGGSAVTNTDGSITSTVSANPDAGFSIVKFTVPASGDFSAGHGLSSTPELVITKSTDTFNWFIYHKDLSSGANGVYMLQFNTNAENGNFKWWGNGMTSSVIGGTSGTAFDASTETIAYCFHSVDGYQKVGSYNQTSGTTTVSTGFEPRFLMMKRTDDAGDWYMYDNQRNDGDKELKANSNAAEVDTSGYTMAFNSDGFVLTVAAGSYDVDYIYLAIA